MLTHADWSALAEAAPGVELHAMDDEIVPLRLIKTDDELEAIGRACALADDGFAHLLQFIQPGMTENEVAWELEAFFRAKGADGLAFPTIALAGPAPRCPTASPPPRRSSAATSCSSTSAAPSTGIGPT